MRHVVLALLGLLVCGLLGTAVMPHRKELPYRDQFARNDAAEWTALGGQWQIQNGAVVNRSDEDGAKLVTGSSRWKDYELDTDLKLIGQNGNVGVIVRVNREELGADSYSGYYVGLRAGDSAFVVGRADFGWVGGRPTLLKGGVRTGTWYHLRVLVVGCRLAAEATNLTTGAVTRLSFREERCEPAGRVGLRSIGMGGAWRHVEVHPANAQQLAAVASQALFTSQPEYPVREDAYNSMLRSFFSSTGNAQATDLPTPAIPRTSVSVGPIQTEKIASAPGERLAFRGVVTLTSPLYIQDSTGGIEVRSSRLSELNLGDEVVVEGTLQSERTTPYLNADMVQVVGERVHVAPIAVTSTQAADGSFDGRYVQLSGVLRSKTLSGDRVNLEIHDGEQTYDVEGQGLLSPGQIQSWEVGSTLRIQGVCVVGAPASGRGGAFTLLLTSMDSVAVLAGPPWWSPHLIARYLALLLAAVTLGVFVYVRVERSKMQAILDERERLAYEMHDTLAQSFAGVGFHLQGIRNGLRAGALPLASVLEKLDDACYMVTHTHREASAEIAALHPDPSDGGDLLSALEKTTLALTEEDAPEMRLVREGTPRHLSFAARDALFQVGREAIANVLRHSQAKHIVMRFRHEGHHILLEISDDGCGFDPQQGDGFGIRAMRRRLQRVGGTLTVRTSPGEGVSVCAHVPRGASYGLTYLGERLTARLRAQA